MVGISNKSLRNALISLISSINQEIGLSNENQVLLVIKLNTEDKLFEFNDWIKNNIQNNKLNATEAEIMRAAVNISKKYDN